MNLTRVLVANRGEIAVRIIRACHALGLQAVAAVSTADRDSLPARLADRAVCIGPARPIDSYLNVGALLAAATGTGCDALHPGYGFLAESPDLATACEQFDVTFVGPKPDHLRQMANKLAARERVSALGVPTVPGSPHVANPDAARAAATALGFPVILKAAAGGGGRGMKVVTSETELADAFVTAAAEAQAAFGNGTLYVERYLPDARHVEVQVLGDRSGTVVQVGERDCSVQRRHQKVVEEAPALAVPPDVVQRIRDTGVALAAGLQYESAGTVEFLYDQDSQQFYFLEMNTRIQVEHPVTEMVSGIDLVQAQLLIADGQPLPFGQADVRLAGHAIECRVTAESPAHDFRPSPGRLTVWEPPTGTGIRVDTHCYAGYLVPPFYDSLLAKLIVHAPTRPAAVQRLAEALEQFRVHGVDTSIPLLRSVVEHPDFVAGRVNTRWLETHGLQKFRASLAAA